VRFPRKIAGGALVAGAVAMAATRLLRARPPAMTAPAPGTPHRWGWRHADLFTTVRGQGPPALLVHDLYTGASGREMASLGDRLEGELTVHTLDLPGFGRSGKPRMRYGPDLFFDALVELVRHEIGAPTLLVGSGLAAAYVVEAAVRLGNEVRGVVLLGPPEPSGPAVFETPTLRPLVYQLLRSPFGELYHHAHAVRSWRRQALRSALAGEPADLDERADELHRSASQPGAAWVLWSLWSGDLAWDPRPALARLGPPALALWGAEARGNPAAPEGYRAVRPDLVQRVIPGTARWPHVDQPDAAAHEILAWWREAAPEDRSASPG
jgi:pimeloyl-ACP methyl ester carboxylesterase